MFWEPQKDEHGKEKPKPFYYDLCQQTVINHNPTARIIGMEEASNIIGGIPEAIKKHYIVHQVDWIRKMLIYKLGGLYVDSDFICLRSLDSVARMSEHFDMVLPKQSTGGWMDNVLIGKQGSKPIKHAADAALRIMTNKKRHIPMSQRRQRRKDHVQWLQPSVDAMTEAVEHWKRKSLILRLPTKWFHPTRIRNKSWFFEPKKESSIPYKESSFGFMTSYHLYKSELNKFDSPKQFLDSDTRIANLINEGLN